MMRFVKQLAKIENTPVLSMFFNLLDMKDLPA